MSTPSPGRERIVTSALRLFADRGADAVTVRDIAADADVSPALILHHFGSKSGLREAVDDHVAGVFDGLRDDAMIESARMDASGITASSFAELLLRNLPPDSPIPAYLRRLLLSGDPAGLRFFRQWHELTLGAVDAMQAAGVARPSADPEVRAAFLMINDLALLLMREHLADTLGFDPLTPDGLQRWTVDVIDAYTTGVFRRDSA